MTITVTHDDILLGRHCDPDCCPIGRALSRAGIPHIGIINGEVLIPDGNHHATGLPLPLNVRDWMSEFDCRQEVEPISFELRIEASNRVNQSRNRQTLQAR